MCILPATTPPLLEFTLYPDLTRTLPEWKIFGQSLSRRDVKILNISDLNPAISTKNNKSHLNWFYCRNARLAYILIWKPISIIHHVTEKKKTHWLFEKKKKNCFKIQYLLMIKIFSKLGTEGNFLNLTEHSLKTYSKYNSEIKNFLHKIGNETRCLLLSLLFDFVLEVLTHVVSTWSWRRQEGNLPWSLQWEHGPANTLASDF